MDKIINSENGNELMFLSTSEVAKIYANEETLNNRNTIKVNNVQDVENCGITAIYEGIPYMVDNSLKLNEYRIEYKENNA